MKANWLVASTMVMALAAGCAGAPDANEPDEPSADEIRVSWQRLVGDWRGTGVYTSLSFTTESRGGGAHAYSGELTVMCVRAPCPAQAEQGAFTTTARTITLRPSDGGTSTQYGFRLAGDVLTLVRGAREVAQLRRVASSDTGIGAVCGGIANIACDAGLSCVLDGSYPDASGHCRETTPHGEGAVCGGIANIACDAGLTCALDGDYPDASGHCRYSGGRGAGAVCGGIANIACDAGLTCVADSDGPDASGHCAAAAPADEGAFCGGIANIACAAGLRCVLDGDYPDASGHCAR